MVDVTCHLYRLRDWDGNLLYVGVTVRPHDRIVTHRRTQPWGHHVVDVEWEAFPNDHEARIAEHRAIANERPIYNKQRPTAERLDWLDR